MSTNNYCKDSSRNNSSNSNYKTTSILEVILDMDRISTINFNKGKTNIKTKVIRIPTTRTETPISNTMNNNNSCISRISILITTLIMETTTTILWQQTIKIKAIKIWWEDNPQDRTSWVVLNLLQERAVRTIWTTLALLSSRMKQLNTKILLEVQSFPIFKTLLLTLINIMFSAMKVMLALALFVQLYTHSPLNPMLWHRCNSLKDV